MVTTEYRVRPVQRYVLTKYTSTTSDDAGVALVGGSHPIGEFDNLERALSAKEAFEAIRESIPGHKELFAVVERGFDIITQVFYADTKESAEALAKEMFQKTGNEWRVFYPA